MADFAAAYAKTMQHEAGYANDSQDKGGETWAGIARKFHATWPGWAIVDRAKIQLGLDRTLDAPAAVRQKLDAILREHQHLAVVTRALYAELYWTPLGLDTEPSQLVAEKAFDIAVNQGVGTAQRFLADARKAADA
jgi:lysozyme family protein